MEAGQNLGKPGRPFTVFVSIKAYFASEKNTTVPVLDEEVNANCEVSKPSVAQKGEESGEGSADEG